MNPLFRIALLASFVLAFSIAASAQTRVTFARGATSKVVSGKMNSYRSERNYVIRVRKGQTLRVEQWGNSNAVTLYIEAPKGGEGSEGEANCNSDKTISPTVSGDYRVTVVECQKVDEWRGKFWVKFTVR